MAKRLSVAFLILFLLANGYLFAQEAGWTGGDDGRHRSPESFDETGFAIWPEDTAEDGLRACRQRADEEPWRRSAAGVIERFALDVFGWDNVEGMQDWSNEEGEVRRLVHGAPVELDLGNVIDAFPYDDCWFISSVQPREGEWGAYEAFVPTASGGARLELRWGSGSSHSLRIEAGYGGHTKRARGGGLLRIPVIPGETGHVLVANYRGNQVESASGWTLPAAPDLEGELTKARRGGYSLYPYGTKRYIDSNCRDAPSFFDFGRYAREPLISFAMDELHIAGSSRAPGITTERLGRTSTWVMRRSAQTFHFDTIESRGGCILLTDVATPGHPIDVSISAADEHVLIDVGDIPGATSVQVTVGYGEESAISASIDSFPLHHPMTVARKQPGYYLAIARGRAAPRGRRRTHIGTPRRAELEGLIASPRCSSTCPSR